MKIKLEIANDKAQIQHFFSQNLSICDPETFLVGSGTADARKQEEN